MGSVSQHLLKNFGWWSTPFYISIVTCDMNIIWITFEINVCCHVLVFEHDRLLYIVFATWATYREKDKSKLIATELYYNTFPKINGCEWSGWHHYPDTLNTEGYGFATDNEWTKPLNYGYWICRESSCLCRWLPVTSRRPLNTMKGSRTRLLWCPTSFWIINCDINQATMLITVIITQICHSSRSALTMCFQLLNT